jgi:cytidylate kinase
LTRLASSIRLDFEMKDGINHVSVDGFDITPVIRTEPVSRAASAVSRVPGVRRVLQRLQKKLGKSGSAVLEGRDIGTVVFPNAPVKFFLNAVPEERARRRFKELQARGEKVSLDRIEADIRKRDHNDQNRELHPLKPAEDAILIDNTGLQPPDTLRLMLRHIRLKLR